MTDRTPCRPPIHETAIVHPEAQVGILSVGPYSIVGPGVVIGER